MKLNTNVRYGLRAILEIGNNTNPILQKEIAERQDIPINYLDSIIASLRNAGLIMNFAGKGSGYVLAKSSKEITVYQIYRAFSPDLKLVNCSCPTNECKRINRCPAKDYWYELNSFIIEKMEGKTLEELIINTFN